MRYMIFSLVHKKRFLVSASYEQSTILTLNKNLEIQEIIPALKKITLQ